MTDAETLFTSYLLILMSKATQPETVSREFELFLGNLEGIEKGTYKPEPITESEYRKIVSTGSDLTIFGSIEENLEIIRRSKDKHSEEFLSFSELQRFSGRISSLVN